MRNNTTRPPDGTPSDFTSDFAQAVTALEAAVFDLIASGWEESSRRRASEMTVALRQAARGALDAVASAPFGGRKPHALHLC